MVPSNIEFSKITRLKREALASIDGYSSRPAVTIYMPGPREAGKTGIYENAHL